MELLNVFETIVLSSLIGSIITLIILIIKGIFRNNLNFTFNYYIWLILLIKLIIPFGPQTALNIDNIYDRVHVQSITNENTPRAQVNPSLQFKNTDLDDTQLISEIQFLQKSANSNGISILLKKKSNLEKVLCFTWMFGIALLMVRLVIGYKGLRKIDRISIKNVSRIHKEILYTCMKAMNIRTEVELSYSLKINSPSLYGFIKPKILIPVSVAVNVSDEEFKYIIMHELAHLKNKDILINRVMALLSMIYWFNPILLYGFHKMRQDCEFSCDGQVISYLEEGENLKYGNAIIRVLELCGNRNRLMGTTSMVMNSLEIKRRIIMISKYKKTNIKGILLGMVIALIIGGFGIALNTSKVSADKNIAKAAELQAETAGTSSKGIINNISNEIVKPAKKSLPMNSETLVTPITSDIVIYNSHADEDYPSGMKVTEVGALLNDKLIKEGFNSRFIKCDPPTEYSKSYETTRDLIIKNVKEYSNTILLDIHRDIATSTNSDMRKILFALTRNNPRYEANKKFVDSLLETIKNSNQIKSDIFFYDNGISYFNQDLSNNSVLIDIGNSMSSDTDIEECVNELVSALKNVRKVSSN